MVCPIRFVSKIQRSRDNYCHAALYECVIDIDTDICVKNEFINMMPQSTSIMRVGLFVRLTVVLFNLLRFVSSRRFVVTYYVLV